MIGFATSTYAKLQPDTVGSRYLISLAPLLCFLDKTQPPGASELPYLVFSDLCCLSSSLYSLELFFVHRDASRWLFIGTTFSQRQIAQRPRAKRTTPCLLAQGRTRFGFRFEKPSNRVSPLHDIVVLVSYKRLGASGLNIDRVN